MDTTDDERDIMPIAILDGVRLFLRHVEYTQQGSGGSLRVYMDSGRLVELSPTDAAAFEAILNKLEREGLTLTFLA